MHEDKSRSIPDRTPLWKYAAHVILFLHVACSLFVVLTPFLVPLGAWLSWSWVHDPWLRMSHLGLVLFITIEVILSKPCPLMVWENFCRKRAGMPLYTTGFFDYWVEEILDIPFRDWMFETVFGLVGVLTIAELFWLSPLVRLDFLT